MASYCRLPSGKWGLKGIGLVSGTVITVTKRDGSGRRERVGKILERFPDGTTIATIGYYYDDPDSSWYWGRRR